MSQQEQESEPEVLCELRNEDELEIEAEAEERRELEPLECDHEFETVERLDKDTVLQWCVVCDFERSVYKPK